jgi:hypothetical protein
MNEKLLRTEDFETETIDCTPTWETAVGMWFFAINVHIKNSGLKTVLDAEKEMLRLARSYQTAVERIAELES